VNQSKLFIKYHSSTSLFADIFILIFRLHMFTTENALFKLKIYAVLRKYFWE